MLNAYGLRPEILPNRHPPDDGLVEAEIAACDGFWQCPTLDAGWHYVTPALSPCILSPFVNDKLTALLTPILSFQISRLHKRVPRVHPSR